MPYRHERNRASGLSARSPSMVISASHESRMAAPLIAASEPERVSRRSRLPERRTGRYRPGRSALARDLLIRAQAGVIAGPSGRGSGSSSCGQRQPVSTPMTAARDPVGMGESISEVCTTRTRDLGTSDLESALHVLGRAGYVRFCERPASCGDQSSPSSQRSIPVRSCWRRFSVMAGSRAPLRAMSAIACESQPRWSATSVY
jgi:hypothetical protein